MRLSVFAWAFVIQLNRNAQAVTKHGKRIEFYTIYAFRKSSSLPNAAFPIVTFFILN